MGDRLVIETVRPNVFAASGDAAEEGAFGELGEPDPGLDGDGRTVGVGGTAADLDLASAGLAAQRQQHSLVEDLDPAAPVLGLIASEVEAGDFLATQAARKADE